MKPILFAALSIAAAAAFAPAHAQYAPYQTPYPTSPARALPPSWSYDPYTSGQASCPQKRPGDTQPCSQIMPPTYGQPSYWPR